MPNVIFKRPAAIELQMDTGHHFFFFALDALNEEEMGLVSLASQDADPWQVSPDFPWIRYRLTTDEATNTVPGLLIAVETRSDLCPTTTKPFSIPLLSPLLDGKPYGAIEIEVRWSKAYDDRLFNLYVDLGNTRTMALIAEQSDLHAWIGDTPLPCYPVSFVPKNWTSDNWLNHDVSRFSIVDSLIVLAKPQFVAGEMTEEDCLSLCQKHGFVECGPAVIGGGTSNHGSAVTLFNCPQLTPGQWIFLSSPKRAIWDNSRGQWGMLERNLQQFRSVRFHGFTNHREGPDRQPMKRDSVVFFCLGILEAALRQIRSPWADQMFGNYNRRLAEIRFAYPSIWTQRERENYKTAWQQACTILAKYHSLPVAPSFQSSLSEAVTAQAPYAYAEQQLLSRTGWLNLYGRPNPECPSIRVINVDIGGGTTDISIITYTKKDSKTDDLEATANVSHSMSDAADTVVKRLIAKFVFPSFLNALFKVYSQEDSEINSQRARDLIAQRGNARHLAVKAINHAFVPLVHACFQQWSSAQAIYSRDIVVTLDPRTKSSALSFPPVNALESLSQLAAELLTQLRLPGLSSNDVILSEFRISKEQLRREIQTCFEPVSNRVGDLIADWDCDVAFFSGKICELKEMKKLFRENACLHKSRLIFSDEFPMGHWYPLWARRPGNGKVDDSKSLSVIGALLVHQQLFSIQENQAQALAYEWYISPPGDSRDKRIIAFPGSRKTTSDKISVRDRSLVWRKLPGDSKEMFELVYRVVWGSSPRRFNCQFSETNGELDISKYEADDTAPSAGAAGVKPEVVLWREEADAFWKDNPDFLTIDPKTAFPE